VDWGPCACAASGALWIAALSWRAPQGAVRAAARGILGGGVAFAAAWAAYGLLERAGMQLSWEEIAQGGGSGLALAAVIGLVEESAKLLGMALVAVGVRPAGRATVVRTVLSVSAVFAVLEAAVVLQGAGSRLLLLRSLLAPVAHAVLAAPLGLVLVGGRSGMRWVAPALVTASTLHAAADLSLATPLGRIGYAAVLIAPAVFLHLYARFSWARGSRAPEQGLRTA
jgi:RsiW-degrading membrane proteinase PrsW (M82 family)